MSQSTSSPSRSELNELQLLDKIFFTDRQYLAKTKLPIFTVSATYREDLKGLHREEENDQQRDIVFSRAHYSMALGTAIAAWGKKIDPKKAWLVDPTNYVTGTALSSVKLTGFVGRTVARWPLLKILKDFVDRYGRQKLPILESITPTTRYLAQEIEGPVLSFHIAAGNILVKCGKEVWQMITDPHVRADYVANASSKNMHFLVFDEETKEEFFVVARKHGKRIPTEQVKNKVIVTGPPIDQRIIACRQHKEFFTHEQTLSICLTTGGLGTNKEEIRRILQQLLAEMKKQLGGQSSKLPRLEVIFYAATHADLKEMAQDLASRAGVRSKVITDDDPAPFTIAENLQQKVKKPKKTGKGDSRFRIIYHPQLVDANELLIHHGFPVAQLFITKPSGDMAYDAVASGAALLTLKEWGEWEFNIRHIFESRKISQKARVDDIIEQLTSITAVSQIASPAVLDGQINKDRLKERTWLGEAMRHAHNIEPLFLQGVDNILQLVKKNFK